MNGQVCQQPIKKVFGRFPRLVRDLARQLKKEISLELVGEDTDLDKNLVEALADPLVHLVRNAVDHGRADIDQGAGGQVAGNLADAGDELLLLDVIPLSLELFMLLPILLLSAAGFTVLTTALPPKHWNPGMCCSSPASARLPANYCCRCVRKPAGTTP